MRKTDNEINENGETNDFDQFQSQINPEGEI